MTRKKKKISPANRFSSVSFKVEETVVAIQPKSVPVNLAEEKVRFLKTGLTPRFQVQDISKIAELANKTKNQIRFDLQGEAEYILEYVRNEYGDGELFLEHAFGSRITKEQATPMVLEYINENALSESLKIHWCDNLACSAKMVWRGPVLNANKPELRKYSLWINWSDENNYMRESGIKCLMDHEIGTHFFRLINDGFQPWFSDRTRFDLRGMGSFEGQCTEEGLASIHTSLRGRVRLLWSPALAYYAACKAAEMSFKELFDHLGRYTSNIDFRWKQVMRVKRGLADPRDLGGFGNDQCYFEGAVKILRNMDNIDFNLLMSGKICMDEIDRIKRVVRKDVLRFPTFMKNMAAYRRTLKKMLILNGLDQFHIPRTAPAAFTKRLEERKKEGDSPRKTGFKKVRSKPFKALPSCKLKNSTAVKKSASLSKEKDMKVKNKEKMSLAEVEMFPVSNMFINTLHVKKGERKQKEQEARTARLEQSVRKNIASLDCGIEERIEQLRSIVREHTWSNSDSEYRDSLISAASSDVPEADLELDLDKTQNNQTTEKQESETETERQMGSKLNFLTDTSSCLDFDLVTSCGSTLYDFDQPEKHNKCFKAQIMKEENQHTVSSSLPNLKILQKQNSDSGKSILMRGGSASARSKLVSKRKVMFPLSVSSLVSSVELNDQRLSSKVAVGDSSDNLGPSETELDNQMDRILNKQQNNAQEVETTQELNYGGEEPNGKTYGPNYFSNTLRKASEKKNSNSLSTEVSTTQKAWNRRQLRPCVKLIPRENLGTSVALKPCVSSSEELFERTLTGPNNSSFTFNNTLSPETTMIKFRMPKLQTNGADTKSLQSSSKTTDTHTSLLITKKSSFLSQGMIDEKQLAGLKLDSLAKKKYSCSVDVPFTQVNNPLAVSQAVTSDNS
ncbi:hypothetical protein ElyMa_004903400 [Elysia marginata]|uniref:Uncharacterized protein n=1 Tax=Elysia marginata TaxID=1093978 RepID=A0AAV4J0F5_9GAST|nr:hypothetical protein ElyMa_004903400 [Elysia marginata]